MGRLSGWLVTDGGEAALGAEHLVNLLDTWFGDRAPQSRNRIVR